MKTEFQSITVRDIVNIMLTNLKTSHRIFRYAKTEGMKEFYRCKINHYRSDLAFIFYDYGHGKNFSHRKFRKLGD